MSRLLIFARNSKNRIELQKIDKRSMWKGKAGGLVEKRWQKKAETNPRRHGAHTFSQASHDAK